ncbi:MAG: hypothetical protein KAS32_16635 [Candidatus Peribacteraceae bacterium]|nr:hypothetical protein [Candidatus Peribacteraceae bacterium]
MKRTESKHIQVKAVCQICGKRKTIKYIEDRHALGTPDAIARARVNDHFHFVVYDDELRNNKSKTACYYKDTRLCFSVHTLNGEYCEDCLRKALKYILKGKWSVDENMFCTVTRDQYNKEKL